MTVASTSLPGTQVKSGSHASAGVRTSALLAILALAALPLHDVAARASALMTTAAPGTLTSLGTAHVGLVYVLVPLAAISASVLFLVPGIFLAVALGAARGLAVWVTSALMLSLVVVSLVAGVATKIAGEPITGLSFGELVTVLGAVTAGLAWWRTRSGVVAWPTLTREERATLALMFVLAAGLYEVMAPKFLWESFNGDGAHAFESSRLLVRQAVPFWPQRAGPLSSFPGMTSMLFAFPNAWYLRLFGELEGSSRFPFLLYVPVLFTALLSLAPDGGRRASLLRQMAVATGLVAYAFAMAYSATYSPYSADLALPAGQDTLLMICFLAAIGSYWRREWAWLALTAFLTYVSLPNGLILLGFLLVADILASQGRWWRPAAWRRGAPLAATIVGCVVVSAVGTRLALALGASPPGGEYGLVGTLRYFAFLQFTDLTRLALVALPAGIVPFVMLFAWRRQDVQARTLTLVTLAYFLFFFVQAHVVLHHFVPAMVLPVAVALRTLPDAPIEARARPVNLGWLAAATLAVVLSLPRTFAVHEAGRDVGRTIAIRTGDYWHSDPDRFHSAPFLVHLFAYDWDPTVPDHNYGGSPTVWNHYATADIDAHTNYVLQRESDAAPAGMHRVAADSGLVLYVRSDSVWAAHRALRPPTPPGSPAYYIPRSIIFHAIPHTGSPPIIDVVATLEAMGIDMTPVLARLGVKR